MLLFQTIIPAVIVFLIFIFGHFFISSSGSGLYISELNIEIDETLDLAEDVNPMDIDPSTGLILPDKYNYLKIENVFSGKLVGSEKLFSIEVALLTKQPTISSDLFIAALAEMEADLVAEITKVILEVTYEQLSDLDGRAKLTRAIHDHLNKYLAEEKDMFPGVTSVFITNLNIV
jgi:flagellar basal body-associated protein FliL